MLADMELSMVRDRNERMLREVRIERLRGRLRASSGDRPGDRHTFGALLSRGLALPGLRTSPR